MSKQTQYSKVTQMCSNLTPIAPPSFIAVLVKKFASFSVFEMSVDMAASNEIDDAA